MKITKDFTAEMQSSRREPLSFLPSLRVAAAKSLRLGGEKL